MMMITTTTTMTTTTIIIIKTTSELEGRMESSPAVKQNGVSIDHL